MRSERTGTAQERLRNLNNIAQLTVLGPVGAVLVVVDYETWWQAAVLVLGVVAALVAVVRWAAGRLAQVALPCLIVTAAVWLFGALAVDSPTAYFGLSVVGPLVVPQLDRRRVLAAFGLAAFVAAVGLVRLLVTQDDGTRTLIFYVLIPMGVTALGNGLMFVNQMFYDHVEEVERSAEREAELAVVQERMRFASDLHDIQGHTLHVVKLKTALAGKLVRTDVERAEEELREIYALVGDTIAQTKELAHAQRRLNLSAELENAKNLFEAAGIHVRVDREAEADAGANELLGQVLRETTTNILRHAQAEQVRITLSEWGITIVNDGVQDAPLPELRGLATLRERVAGSGGELTVEQKDGHFLTAAEFPRGRSGAAL